MRTGTVNGTAGDVLSPHPSPASEPQSSPARAVRGFATCVGADSSRESMLDELISAVCTLVPGVQAVACLDEAAPDYGPEGRAASHPDAFCLNKLEVDLGEGPQLLAIASGEPCLAPDLSTDSRFPRFGSRAVEAGSGSAFAFPLRGGASLGVLELYHDASGPMPPWVADVELLVEVMSTLLQAAQARAELSDVARTLRESTHRDPLTGLANRTLLLDRLAQALRRGSRSARPTAVLFVDIDGFKAINDAVGHGAGDEILAEFAARLTDVVRPADTVARLGGDEFVVLCEEIDERTDAAALAGRIEARLAAPFDVGGHSIRLGASIGVALADAPSERAAGVLRDADEDMYRVKRARREGGSARSVRWLRDVGASTLTVRLSLRLAGQLVAALETAASRACASHGREAELEAELDRLRQENTLLQRTSLFVGGDPDRG